MDVAASAPRTLDSIADVAASAWNALQPAGTPFLRHEFLAALESSGSACDATGWTPRHLLLEDGAGHLLAASASATGRASTMGRSTSTSSL